MARIGIVADNAANAVSGPGYLVPTLPLRAYNANGKLVSLPMTVSAELTAAAATEVHTTPADGTGTEVEITALDGDALIYFQDATLVAPASLKPAGGAINGTYAGIRLAEGDTRLLCLAPRTDGPSAPQVKIYAQQFAPDA